MTGPTAAADPAVAVVVAAGSSTRMGGADKLYAPLAGRTVLERSVAAVAAVEAVREIVVVVAPGRESAATALVGGPAVDIVTGGSTRSASVAAGLRALGVLPASSRPGDPVVLVHDAARPLASPELVRAVVVAAAHHGAAIPVLPVPETLKRIDDAGRIIATVDRRSLAAAQTPQGARASLLARAFLELPAGGDREFTDEAARLEACRIPVQTIPGDPVNLKVTVPADLARAAALLDAASTRRVGYGTDSHRFGPGVALQLGGVAVPAAPRLHGHSDGDVALHAVADALLGAAGLGDLGRLFPADARTPVGVSSRDLLASVLEHLERAGWRPAALDLTIVGARPRLAGHLDEIRSSVARILGLGPDSVDVKAATGNLSGDAGAGRGMEAVALATIQRSSSAAGRIGSDPS